MTDQTSTMELDENRITKPLARPRISASAISAEGPQGTRPPGSEDAEWPPLPVTPDKQAANRQRLDRPGAGQNAHQLEMQEELSALQDNEPPKQQPKARRSIGHNLTDSEAETDVAPEAVPDGELQVRPRSLQRTRSGPSGADFTHSTTLEYQPNTRQPRPSPLPPGWRMLLLATVVLVVPQPPDQTLWPPHAPGPWELKWPISGQHSIAHSSSPTQLAAPPPRELSPQPFGYVPHALTTHLHTGCPLGPTPEHQRNTTRGNQSHSPQCHHTLVGLSAQISGQRALHTRPGASAHHLHGNDPPTPPLPPLRKSAALSQ